MAFDVQILSQQRLSVIFYSGTVTTGDFDSMWRTISGSKDFDWDFDELAVFGPDADVAALDFESVFAEAMRFKATHENVKIERKRRSAIVVSSDLQALNGRMFLAYVAANPPPNLEFKMFNKLSAALAWIEETRPETRPAKSIDRAEVDRALGQMDRSRLLAEVRRAQAG